jgi:hypothetical protein
MLYLFVDLDDLLDSFVQGKGTVCSDTSNHNLTRKANNWRIIDHILEQHAYCTNQDLQSEQERELEQRDITKT